MTVQNVWLLKITERFFQHFFFGNYFYGCCVVALAIEANLQQGFTLNNLLFYILLFSSTVLYYTYAYLRENPSVSNLRSEWYTANKKRIQYSQIILTVTCLAIAIYQLINWQSKLLKINPWEWLLLAIFPLLAIWYYGDHLPFIKKSSLRSKGWIKPFVIGFIWAGVVTIYPSFFAALEKNQSYEPAFFSFLLFVKNGMYITMLCILFDIKDYATDHNLQLKTFVVRYGLRKTLFYIIMPLTIVGLATLLTYGISNGFPPLRIAVNTIPFLMLIIVTYYMHRRKSILYYLAIIDGMMLLKALCGIAGSFIAA